MIDIADVISIASDRVLHGAEFDIRLDGDVHFIISYKLKGYVMGRRFNLVQLSSCHIDWRVIISDRCDEMISKLIERVS